MPHSKFTWAIVGPGAIAHRFAEAVRRLPDNQLAIVCGRDALRSATFARQACCDDQHVAATTELQEVLDNPTIDGVYIATPHSHHAAPALRALRAGKAVLCEKPLTATAAQARTLIDEAAAQQTFLMEALWTRFLPIYHTVGTWLSEGKIGAVRSIQSSFCFNVAFDPRSRLFDRSLAGGCLLDIGIYNLSMSRWVIAQQQGTCPEPRDVSVFGRLAPTGVEQHVAAQLHVENGLAVQFICGFDSVASNDFRITGEYGYISLPGNFWEATEATLHVRDQAPMTLSAPFAINGFEYQIAEVLRCTRAGRIESPQLPHSETLATLRWIDRLRKDLGAPDFSLEESVS